MAGELHQIRILFKDFSLSAELYDTPTTNKLIRLLPVEGKANTWGEEIYFDIPLNAELEPGARAEVEVGELGYWPVGSAFCIFFGRTPMSRDEKPRAASPVNVIGRIVGNCSQLKSVNIGSQVIIEKP